MGFLNLAYNFYRPALQEQGWGGPESPNWHLPHGPYLGTSDAQVMGMPTPQRGWNPIGDFFSQLGTNADAFRSYGRYLPGMFFPQQFGPRLPGDYYDNPTYWPPGQIPFGPRG